MGDPLAGRHVDRRATPVRRYEYVPPEREAALLVPDEAGRPRLRFALVHRRLALVSTLVPDACIDPRSPHLGTLRLFASPVRGSAALNRAFEQAERHPGAAVELRREPDNPYDADAVQLRAPGARTHFGYVQRGRVPTVARLMDRGVEMAGITMYEGLVLLGPRDTLEHLGPVPVPVPARRRRRSFRDWLSGRTATV